MKEIKLLCSMLVAAILLGACQSPTLPPAAPAFSQIEPGKSLPGLTATPELSTISVGSELLVTSGAPCFIYQDDDALIMQVGGAAPIRAGTFAGKDSILDAKLMGNHLYVLYNGSLQHIELKTGVAKGIIELDKDKRMLYGELALDPAHLRVFYNGVDASSRVMGGVYEQIENSVHPFPVYAEELMTLSIVGVSEDGRTLYLLPRGQDADFRTLKQLNITLERFQDDLSIAGTRYAVLAPDSRSLATLDRISDGAGGLVSVINVYDLSTHPLAAPGVFRLPKTPSDMGYGGMAWSLDSRKLFFLLVDDLYASPQPSALGLWSLDVETGESAFVAAIPDASDRLAGISPNGTVILVRDDDTDKTYLVNVQTGIVEFFKSPVLAKFAGWR